MADLVRGRLSLFFAVAAPFTLLVDMSLRVFGPTPPKTTADFTTSTLFWLVLLPGLIASLAQLSVAGLILRPQITPRTALAAALVVWPVYMAALILSSLPFSAGFVLLTLLGLPPAIAISFPLLLGIYIFGRLLPIVAVAIMSPKTSPLAMLRTSWSLTQPNGWTLAGFMLPAILGIIGLSLIAGGVGSALGTVFTILGFAEVSRFAAGLIPAIASTFVAIGSAAIASLLYKKLS